ncbi:MAG: arylsulfatase [Opitutaceae bacterium]|nr:arylsulfatase [Opitutaceae bacterium]
MNLLPSCAGVARHLLLAGLLLPLVGVTAPAASSTDRPNIVVIYADDLGIGDVSCYNAHSAWQTPHIDRLAREGVLFTDAHSASALCTPSRYALLTGRYAWRGKLKHGVLQGYDSPLLEPNRLTIADFLHAHGYATAAIGKWHLGLAWRRPGPRAQDVDFGSSFGGGPLAHGFDHFFGISASLDMPPYVWLRDNRATEIPAGQVGDSDPPRLWRAGPIASSFRMEEVQPQLIAEAMDWMRNRAKAGDGRPFFLYLALAAPHTPTLPTAGYAGRTGTTDYGDFVTQVDADVGRLLDAISQSGLKDNTLVLFTSDNGFAPAAGLSDLQRIGHDPSAGYRGYKSDLYEGGHRIPFIVHGKGVTEPGRRSPALVGQLDLFATCAALLGVRLPENAAEDSVSFLPSLRKASATGRDTIVNHSGEGRFAIREGRWKLLLWPGSGGWSPPTDKPSRWLKTEATDLASLPRYQLFDLEKDPAETTNLAEQNPDLVQRLARRLCADIERGRSTPGSPQPVIIDNTWPEVSWMRAFSNRR